MPDPAIIFRPTDTPDIQRRKLNQLVAAIGGEPTAWGDIGGTLSNQLDLQAALDGKVPASRLISTTSPLSGGGDLSANRTISLADTAVSPGTYGDATHAPQFTVDQKGRLTAAANVAISGGGFRYEAAPATIPVIADFTAGWVNQGTSTISDTPRGLRIVPQSNGAARFLLMAAPAAPFSVYMRGNMLLNSTSSSSGGGDYGLVFRDSSDGEAFTWASEPLVTVSKYVTGQRWSGSAPPTLGATTLLQYNTSLIHWLRADVSSTTITLYVSVNGIDWEQRGTETISAYLDAVNQVGIYVRSDTAGVGIAYIQQFGFTAPT